MELSLWLRKSLISEVAKLAVTDARVLAGRAGETPTDFAALSFRGLAFFGFGMSFDSVVEGCDSASVEAASGAGFRGVAGVPIEASWPGAELPTVNREDAGLFMTWFGAGERGD